MDRSFLEGIDPESIEDVEWRFKDVIKDEKLEKLLREVEEEGLERSRDEDEFTEWKKKMESAYAEAPGALKEWVIKAVNDKVEELGKLYEELSGLDYREKNSYVVSLVLSALEHPEYPEGEGPEAFLETERPYIESVLEKWLLQRSLQIRKMLKTAEEGWKSNN